MYLVHIYAYPYKYTYIQVLMAQNSCISQPYPQAPREVRVACRQLVGTLLLGDCCQQLKIQVSVLGNKLLSPSEFEAAAGCSKGKNWKVCTQTPFNVVHTDY